MFHLARSQPASVAILSVNELADQYIIPASGALIQAMAEGQLVLDIRTAVGNYRLPVAAMDLAQVASQLEAGAQLAGVQFHVNIGRSDAATVAQLEAAASQGGYVIVSPPVDFVITASYNGRTVAVNRFNTYIQREIPIPEGTDPNRVTTAVVMDETRHIHHVPTAIVERNGRYNAVIYSLTNSTYALIRHTKTFADMDGHWAKNVVEDMASRLVVMGVDEERFAPNVPITREQMVALLIRTLGLPERVGLGQPPFRDVSADAWYAGAVAQAKQYGLLTGYQDGTFRPGRYVTRLEAFVMLSREMALAGLRSELPAEEAEATLAKFVDGENVAGWARPYVAAAVQYGLVAGANGQLLPSEVITRAETAVILQRFLAEAGWIQRPME